MTTRIKKVVPPSISSRTELETEAGLLAKDMVEQRRLQNELDRKIAALRTDAETRLGLLQAQIEQRFTRVQGYADQHPELFDGKKSADLVHAVIGYRIGNPYVDRLKGWTPRKVIEALRERLPAFIRTADAVDKEAVLAARAQLEPKLLERCGLKIAQDETFFVEPKIAEQESRLTTDC